MDDPIDSVEQALEDTARACLRLIGTRTLKPQQYQRLAKWMFGCLNQRYTIRQRVHRRGAGELKKVLKFIAGACETLLEIDEDSRGSS